jgi:hypothetical protein
MSHLQDILGLYGFSESQSQGLLDALEVVNCPINYQETAKEQLDSLNESLQNCFLRPSGSERQQLSDKFKDEKLRATLLPLLSPFIDSIYSGNDVPIKMLLGAAENGVNERFKILALLENNGQRTDLVYLLGGKRELWIDHEPIATKFLVERLVKNNFILQAEAEVEKAIDEFFPNKNNIQDKRSAIVKHFTDKGIIWPTESDMMKELALKYAELSDTKFISVDAPMKLNDKGQLVRPDTLDTFIQLWKDHGEAILLEAKNHPSGKLPMAIVTTQPYGAYQYTQAMAIFHDKPVNISVVADGVSNPVTMNIATALDSFARTIYAGKNVVLSKLLAIENNQKQEF